MFMMNCFAVENLSVLLKKVQNIKNKNFDCEDVTEKFRETFNFIPPTVQETILKNTIKNLSKRVPSIPTRTLEKLVKNFANSDVPEEEACKFSYKTFSDKMSTKCLDSCIQKSDLTFERIVKTLEKCSINWKCYIDETDEISSGFSKCIGKCVE